MSDAGRQLTDSTHFLGLYQLRLSLFQFESAIDDLLFEGAIVFLDLLARLGQRHDHPIERRGQMTDFISLLDVDGTTQISPADLVGYLHELLDRLRNHANEEGEQNYRGDENDEGQNDGRRPGYRDRFHDTVERKDHPYLADLLVDMASRQRSPGLIDHAEHLAIELFSPGVHRVSHFDELAAVGGYQPVIITGFAGEGDIYLEATLHLSFIPAADLSQDRAVVVDNRRVDDVIELPDLLEQRVKLVARFKQNAAFGIRRHQPCNRLAVGFQFATEALVQSVDEVAAHDKRTYQQHHRHRQHKLGAETQIAEYLQEAHR